LACGGSTDLESTQMMMNAVVLSSDCTNIPSVLVHSIT
jgi:hypothetical protein